MLDRLELFNFRIPRNVESANGTGGGLDGEATLGARARDKFDGLVVGMLAAEVEDELLVGGGERAEEGTGFHK